MIARKVTPEEFVDAVRIQAQAFHYEKFEEPKIETGEEHKYVYATFDDEGHMLSSLVASPQDVNYFGQFVPMASVGGVASLPESRRGGSMRKLITFMLEDAYARGDKLAGLYPFSHEFYRKFGFELCCRKWEAYLPMNTLAHFPDNGKAVQFFPGMDEEVLDNIWAAHVKNVNLSCSRTGKWKRRKVKDPYQDRVYLYVWYNDENVPLAYIQFTPDRKDGTPNYRVQEVAYVNQQGLFGVLGFMKKLSAQGLGLKWTMDARLDPFMLCPEPYDVKAQMVTAGMARLVDVQWCLKNRPWPRADESLVIKVTDDTLPVNSGTYKVTLNEKVQVEKTEENADMDVSVQCLTLLCLGAESLEKLLLSRKDIQVHGKKDLISSCFPKYDNQFTEMF